MNATSLLAIGGGAVLGAWLRYALGLWLNPLLPTMPLGTLAANLIGGYLVGLVIAVFQVQSELDPIWHLALACFMNGICLATDNPVRRVLFSSFIVQ